MTPEEYFLHHTAHWMEDSYTPVALIPADDRCWRCDARPAAQDSPCGLCSGCRDALLKSQEGTKPPGE